MPAHVSEQQSEYSNIKVRRSDYETIKSSTGGIPVKFVDIFTAMRMAWQEIPVKRRIELLGKTRPTRSSAA